MEILPIIADTTLNKLGVLEEYKSLIWTSRYYSPGDFELCINVNPKAIEFLQINNYIMRDDDENVGIIEKIIIGTDADGQELMIASGRFISSILNRRIIATQTVFNNQYVSSVINTLLTNNIINPSIAARKINNFVSGITVNMGPQITTQFTGQNLCDAVSNLCETYGLGFNVIINSSGQFEFELYEGVDHSYGQSTNPYVVFSEKYDNLISSQYEENHQTMITNILVAGEGEGTDRITAWTSGNNSGLARYESYKDARDMSTNEGEISQSEYLAQLTARGTEDLTDFTTAFSGEVDFSGIRYKQDVNLGDIVVVENSRWGISMNCRLVEIIESVDETGAYTINPTFGE